MKLTKISRGEQVMSMCLLGRPQCEMFRQSKTFYCYSLLGPKALRFLNKPFGPLALLLKLTSIKSYLKQFWAIIVQSREGYSRNRTLVGHNGLSQGRMFRSHTWMGIGDLRRRRWRLCHWFWILHGLRHCEWTKKTVVHVVSGFKKRGVPALCYCCDWLFLALYFKFHCCFEWVKKAKDC